MELSQNTFVGTGPQGHRSRMRGRLLAAPVALADYEILEMVLFLGIPRRDTKPQAKGLINRFGSLAAALCAPPPALSHAGLPGRVAEVFALVTEAATCLGRAERMDRVVLSDWDALDRYLDAPARAGRPCGVSVLLLNNRNQMLGELRLADDAEDRAGLTRQVLRLALDRHATAAILLREVHGPPAPAAEDVALLAHVRRAGAAVSVAVHDLVIVGGGGWISAGRRG